MTRSADRPHPRRRLGRGGFTLTETLVSLAVVGVVAGVVVSRMITPQENSETGALAQNLGALNASVQAFRGDVGRYPGRLEYLTAPPPAGATDACGRSIPPQQRAEWSGPYLTRQIGPGGIRTGDGTIANQVRRDPPARGSDPFGHLLIDASEVESRTATSLDKLLDGGDGFTTGTVRWTAQGATSRGNVVYRMPVRGC